MKVMHRGKASALSTAFVLFTLHMTRSLISDFHISGRLQNISSSLSLIPILAGWCMIWCYRQCILSVLCTHILFTYHQHHVLFNNWHWR